MQKTIIEGPTFTATKISVVVQRKQPYRAQCAILIEGNLNTVILKAALENVVNRHEIRTTFNCCLGWISQFKS